MPGSHAAVATALVPHDPTAEPPKRVPSGPECHFCDISAAADRWLEDPGAITALAYGEAIG